MRTKAKIACSHSCKLDITPYTYCCHTNIGQLFYLIGGVFFLLQLMHWLFICTCWSIRAFKGLMTTPIAEFPIARGARNRQRDFPAPVAILTNTSLPWTRDKSTSKHIVTSSLQSSSASIHAVAAGFFSLSVLKAFKT